MATNSDIITNPEEYITVYYWRDDSINTPIDIQDRFRKGVMGNYRDYKTKDDVRFILQLNTNLFGRGIFASNNKVRKVEFSGENVLIDSFAFQYSGVEEVIFNGVTVIGGGAFLNCKHLKRVFIPESVKSIGVNAFEGCDILEHVDMKGAPMLEENCFIDAKYENAEYIGKCLHKALSESIDERGVYEVKGGTKVIGCGAFEDCVGVKTIIVPDSVMKIGYNAFIDCTADIEIQGCPELIYGDKNHQSIFGNETYDVINVTICDTRMLSNLRSDVQYANPDIVISQRYDVDSNGVIKPRRPIINIK